jgi:hypothetical protein
LVATFGAIRGTQKIIKGIMTVREETPGNNTSNLAGCTTTTFGGEGSHSGHEHHHDEGLADDMVTPKFLQKNRQQILNLLEQEERERMLKEVKARLQFEDSPKDGGGNSGG